MPEMGQTTRFVKEPNVADGWTVTRDSILARSTICAECRLQALRALFHAITSDVSSVTIL